MQPADLNAISALASTHARGKGSGSHDRRLFARDKDEGRGIKRRNVLGGVFELPNILQLLPALFSDNRLCLQGRELS